MDQANGSAPAIQSDDPPLARRTVASAMEAALAPGMAHANEVNVTPLAPGAAHRPATNAPYHVHGSVLEGGDSPAVLAQPAAAHAEGKGSAFHPAPRSARRTREVLADAQDALVTRYRRVSDTTDDFVHDNPWKAIAMAAVGGLIVGLLAAR
ncbi:membrane protein [Caballeronia peredens]|nr:membrane protein [Caballeronia peredens]